MSTADAFDDHVRYYRRKRSPSIDERKRIVYIEGLCLYLFCVTVPMLFGVVIRYFDHDRSNDAAANNNAFDNNRTVGGTFTTTTTTTTAAAAAAHDSRSFRSRWNFWSVLTTDSGAVLLTTMFLAATRLVIARYYCGAVDDGSDKSSALTRCRSWHVLKHSETEDTINNSNNNSNNNRNDKNDKTENDERNSRRAAATFRFAYALAASISGWRCFRNAEFWPRALGGRGSTDRCWDLSAGIALVSDDDFDDSKFLLRIYFLVQVAYQTQSLIFRTVTFLTDRTSSSSSSSSTTTTRSVGPPAERAVTLALMAGSFLFSSWRRLTTVAMFALDVSGLFLHFLQLFLLETTTATTEGKKVDRTAVWFVHRCLVVPSFVYFRFFVLPFVVGYSAAFESKQWLRHMEYAFVPGWGDTVYFFFNGLMAVSIVLNLIAFRRLLFHPRVARILETKKRRS